MPTFQPLSAKLRPWLLPASILILMLLLQALGLTEPLRYARGAVAAGEWWRLLSANLVHLGWHHLLMNSLALLLVWLLFGASASLRQWAGILIGSMLGVTLGLFLLDPSLQWYVGLSGVLHGLFAAGVVTRWQRQRGEALVMGAALVAKLAWEQVSGGSIATATFVGGAVVVDAHLYGALAGLAMALLLLRRGRGRAGRAPGTGRQD